MTLQKIKFVRADAEAHYASGYGCAEAVLLALADLQEIASPLVPGMATAFCGGMARTGGTCGALTGAVLGISLALGRSEQGEPREAVNAAVQQLVREFEQAFGYRNCDELEHLAQFASKEFEGRLGLPCAAYTGAAAEIAACILSGHKRVS